MKYLGSFVAESQFDETSWNSLIESIDELLLTETIKIENPMTGDLLDIDNSESLIARIEIGAAVGGMRATHRFSDTVEFWGDQQIVEFAESIANEYNSTFAPYCD